MTSKKSKNTKKVMCRVIGAALLLTGGLLSLGGLYANYVDPEIIGRGGLGQGGPGSLAVFLGIVALMGAGWIWYAGD